MPAQRIEAAQKVRDGVLVFVSALAVRPPFAQHQ
jgi:hypothetical protein